jgi:hypothetical protein
VLPFHFTTGIYTVSKMAMVDDGIRPPLLATLPEELCLAIIEKLDISSIIALSQTSRRFNRLSDPTEESRHSQMIKFLVEVQAFPRWKNGFACFFCLKVLPRCRFTDKQTKSPRGRNGSEQEGRFCIQCGIEKGWSPPGSMVKQGDVIRMVCRQCKRLEGGRFCDICKICSHCDPYRFTLRNCERMNGHKIIGQAIPSVERSQALPVCLATALGLGLQMSEYEALTGDSASPEWFDGPEDIGL